MKIKKIDKEKINWLTRLDNGAYIFSCPYAEIDVPVEYFDTGIAEVIGDNVRLFGLFTIKCWFDEDIEKTKPKLFFFKFHSKILTSPSRLEDSVDENGNKVLKLCFDEGSPFLVNESTNPDLEVAQTFLDIMTLGYLPNVISYEEITRYWTAVNDMNGIKLKEVFHRSAYEMLVSEIIRDPLDLSRPFRLRLRDDPDFSLNGWNIVNIRLLPRYSSTFASVMSGNPKGNIVSIISRERSGKKMKGSPIEEAIL